jgi:hypothetical protein
MDNETETGHDYERVIQQGGIQTIVCENRFEIIANPRTEVAEYKAVQDLREWIKRRNKKVVRMLGDMSR